MPIRRLDLKVGFSCNNNCLFCAQAHKRELGDQSTKILKQHLKKAYKEDGCDEVVFTGGEPTIRKDLPELISYAKEAGYTLIQIQSNGRKFYYESYVKELISSGVTEFSPAIHGHKPEIHDALTQTKGSFEQVKQGIKNLKKLDQHVVTNSVITKFNYKHLPELADILIKLKVDQFQFAFVHPCGNAMRNFEDVVPNKSKVAPFVHKALDKAIDAGYKTGEVMVEAFPFCFMQGGYEKFCSELYIPPAEVIDAEIKIKKFEEWRVHNGKIKFPQCKLCKFDSICEGPWKEYPEFYGSKEFKPVSKDIKIKIKKKL